MKSQNQVILSIGSNQGERLESILECINLIHLTIGTVIKVSKLYETPAWGFESDAFYNGAIAIHTDKSPQKVWTAILKIEKQLGRVRTKQMGYEARTIDIDIVSFNNEIITTQNLQIPHPQMQNRLFVLLPVQDLDLDFIHPVLSKTIAELINESEDKSDCIVIQSLEKPLDKFNFKQFNYIAIEGNIGAGKTTLTKRIAEDFNAKMVLERFADNPFLPKFYKDKNRYAFSLELSFLADRYQQLSDDLAQFDLFKDFIVGDYHIFKSLIFAKITLSDDEYRLYRKLFEIVYKEMPKPDLYVYLYQNTDRLLTNIKNRGRSYEQNIEGDYLEKINRGYLDYIKSQFGLKVLIIDISNRDFVKNQSDYLYILQEIQKNLDE